LLWKGYAAGKVVPAHYLTGTDRKIRMHFHADVATEPKPTSKIA